MELPYDCVDLLVRFLEQLSPLLLDFRPRAAILRRSFEDIGPLMERRSQKIVSRCCSRIIVLAIGGRGPR